MKLKNIPICAITDENLTFTVPALFISILENSSEDYFYRFYCFVNHKVSDEDRNKICAIQDSYENCSVEIVDMGRTYQDCINRHPTVTNACLYKFAIIDKLPQYDKVIYLDTDIVVLDDISTLYDIDLKDNYVGGVFNIFYYMVKRNLISLLNIPDLESYFNAGVMLMNTRKMREDNIIKELEKYAGQFEGSVDQHIFNKVCYGKILNIPPKYNLTLKYQELYNLPEANAFYTKQEIDDAINSPVIMHYTGDRKPWKYANLQFSWKWYKYYKMSPFKDLPLDRQELILRNKDFLLGIKIQNLLLKVGKELSDRLNLKVDYFQFFSVVKLLKKKHISPICFIIKSANLNKENNNLIELISKLREQGSTVFVISHSGGRLSSKFKKVSNYFFIIKDVDIRIMRALRIFKFVVISEAEMYKTVQKIFNANLSYLWLIDNLENKEKFANKYPVVSELLNDSKNIIYGYDLDKISNILVLE